MVVTYMCLISDLAVFFSPSTVKKILQHVFCVIFVPHCYCQGILELGIYSLHKELIVKYQ